MSAICDAYYQIRRPHLARPDNLKFSLAPIKAELGNLHPSMISQKTIDAYASSRGRANATIMRELKCLRAALAWGRDNLNTPAPRFRMPVKDSKPRDRWLTKAEARRLVDACESPHIELFVQIALATGARSNAICELTWRQVDLESGRINFGEDVGKKRRAVVPINNQLRAALVQAANIRTTDYVIEYHKQQVKDVRGALTRAARKAGLGKLGKHALRHTAATWMVMDGRPYQEIARYLGATVAMIERVYGHHNPDWLKSASESLEF